ncbi:hypothetical protein OGAPHI_005031 [Ogataea philodendri]|uniref:SED5-binding protein 3 n=1 Tax=Ogataea philodendri TaxID=1378263 RepID=A0A9P8P1M7_9ASCO|nr:uncharacterized protein OGAPHI_005031 [Ogataea philodendri]KAH3663630.1 hypothetical protein OGAPHI_005031 [Ogataea philodendri]
MNQYEETVNQLGNLSVKTSKKKRTNHVHHQFTPEYARDDHIDSGFDPNAAAMSPGMQAPHYYNGQHTPSVQPSSQSVPIMSDQYQPQTEYFAPKQQIGVDPASTDDLSIPNIRYQLDHTYKDSEFLTFENVSPPLAGTQYVAVDQGNASPKFVRMTLYSVPSSEKLRQQSKIPLGLVLTPFAPTQPGEKPVPEVDCREMSAVPRCRRCRTYINPAMQHGGYNMICNICSFSSPVPQEYLSQVDANGVRSDYYERPELHSGVYDLVVPEDYNLDEKPPQPLHHVFLVDLSYQAIRSKLHVAACSAIRMALYQNGESNLPQGSKVSIIGFADKLFFYNLSPSLEQSTVAVVGDLEDPFVPFHDGILADPLESSSIIDTTLSFIEQIVDYSGPEPAYGAALLAAKMVLEPVAGGQVVAFLSSISSWGPGSLAVKLPTQKTTSDYDKDVIVANNKFYQDLLKQFVKSNVGLHLLNGSHTPIDLANAGLIAIKTGGSVKTWHNFNLDKDEADLMFTVKQLVTDACGYQGQLKIRCSSGLQVNKYYGGFTSSGQPDIPYLPVLSSQTSLACDFVYDGKLDTKKDSHFQAALLYTSADGKRKVRVINCIMSVTERVADVFSFSDQDAVLNIILKESLSRLPAMNFVTLRSYLNTQLADINAMYKLYVAKNTSSPGQLVLPHGLRTFPMFLLSALKSKAIKERNTNPDLRVESLFDLQTFTPERLSAYLYPLMISLHDLDDSECLFEGETQFFTLPQTRALSQTNLEIGGAYLIFNSKRLYLWFHSDVNPLLLQDLFGSQVTSLDQLDPLMSQLPPLDTHISLQVRNLVKFLAKHYLNADFFPVEICRFKTDTNESEFIELLYEDRSGDLQWSYSDFLKHLHKQITSKVEVNSTSSTSDKKDSSTLAHRFGIF